ncbi:MAG: hypothetical protein Q8P33_03695 [bacterium]|nr:hypothetical protein [bacterium]
MSVAPVILATYAKKGLKNFGVGQWSADPDVLVGVGRLRIRRRTDGTKVIALRTMNPLIGPRDPIMMARFVTGTSPRVAKNHPSPITMELETAIRAASGYRGLGRLLRPVIA